MYEALSYEVLQVLDGFMLSHLADQYALSINSGASLNIGDAWTQVLLVFEA